MRVWDLRGLRPEPVTACAPHAVEWWRATAPHPARSARPAHARCDWVGCNQPPATVEGVCGEHAAFITARAGHVFSPLPPPAPEAPVSPLRRPPTSPDPATLMPPSPVARLAVAPSAAGSAASVEMPPAVPSMADRARRGNDARQQRERERKDALLADHGVGDGRARCAWKRYCPNTTGLNGRGLCRGHANKASLKRILDEYPMLAPAPAAPAPGAPAPDTVPAPEPTPAEEPIAGPWIARADGTGWLRRGADKAQLVTVRFREPDGSGRGTLRACCYWYAVGVEGVVQAAHPAAAFLAADTFLGERGYVLRGGFELALEEERQRPPVTPPATRAAVRALGPRPPLGDLEEHLRRRLAAVDALRALPLDMGSAYSIRLCGSDGLAEAVFSRDADTADDRATFDVVAEAIAGALQRRRAALEALAYDGVAP